MPSHVGYLVSDDRVIDQTHAKGFPFMGMLKRLLQTHTGESVGLYDDAPTFMIEVAHYVFESFIFLFIF